MFCIGRVLGTAQREKTFEYVQVETKRRRANVKRVAQFDGKSDETRNGDPRHFEDTLRVN